MSVPSRVEPDAAGWIEVGQLRACGTQPPAEGRWQAEARATLLHLQLRQSAAHAHFPGAVGEEDYQAAVVLGGVAAGVGLVLGAQIEAGQKETRAGLPPRKTVEGRAACRGRMKSALGPGR